MSTLEASSYRFMIQSRRFAKVRESAEKGKVGEDNKEPETTTDLTATKWRGEVAALCFQLGLNKITIMPFYNLLI